MVIYLYNTIIDEINHNSRIIKAKFWLIPNLGYKILIGRNLIHHLGYQLVPIDKDDQVVNTDIVHKADLSHLQLAEDDVFYARINYDVALDNIKTNTSNETKTIMGNCSQWLAKNIRQLLHEYRGNIATNEADVGKMPGFQLKIRLKPNAKPFKLNQPYNLHPYHREEAYRQIQVLLNAGWIRPSRSPWAAGITFSAKKNGELRMCIDFRQLNLRIVDERFPMPTMTELLSKFKNKKYLTSIDLKSGYWNIEVAEEDREKLAFITPWGLYEWNRMPFGIKTAPMVFQKAMYKIFEGLDFVLVYLDDIVILSDNEKQHLKHIREVLHRLQRNNIKMRLDKCTFAVSELEYLGHIVNADHQKPTPGYTGKIINCKVPKSKKDVEAFLGLCNWIGRFIPNLSQLTKGLYSLTHKNKHFIWEDEHQKAFDVIKKAIHNIKALRLPDINKTFYVETDASNHSLGAVLLQKDENDVLQPVEWLSKSFDQSQTNWSIGEKECYAAIYAIERWERYLKPNRFILYTDHKNLALLFNFARIFKGNKLWRWALRLQEYSFTVTARPGTAHIVSDYLSRYNHHFRYDTDPPQTKYKTIYFRDEEMNIIAECSDIPTYQQNIREQIHYAKHYVVPKPNGPDIIIYPLSKYLAYHTTNHYCAANKVVNSLYLSKYVDKIHILKTPQTYALHEGNVINIVIKPITLYFLIVLMDVKG